VAATFPFFFPRPIAPLERDWLCVPLPGRLRRAAMGASGLLLNSGVGDIGGEELEGLGVPASSPKGSSCWAHSCGGDSGT
jgi:hypothetical protein